MTHVKKLGLVVVAATALMAFAGAGTASAAGGVLCEEIGEPCAAAEKWAVNAHMTFDLKAGTKTKLTATGGQVLVECAESKITGKVLNAGTNVVKAMVEVQKEWLTWGMCSSPMVTSTPGLLEIEYRNEPGTKGTVFANNFVITAIIGGIDCHYKSGTGTDIGKYTPGAEGKDGILAVSVVTALENSAAHPSSPLLCPPDVVWDGEYTLTGNTALYIKGE
ncbi:MAG: hypothetical protein ACTHK3_12870 [Solirubrobacterales bacterium]